MQDQNTGREAFDVIVVGGGIGGLTAAALLAKAGKAVLLVERHDRPGGYAHGFRRKRYIFDAGVHLTSGCRLQGYPGGQIIAKVLHAVGGADGVEFIAVNPFTQAFYPGIEISMPQTVEAFAAMLSGLFPSEAQGIRDFLQLCQRVAEQASVTDDVMLCGDSGQIQQRLPLLVKYRRATLAEVCRRYLGNARVVALFATHWPYLGLPPSKVSFIYWAMMFIGYLSDGAYYCKGGFQSWAEALVRSIRDNAGEVRYNCAVERIMLEKGRAQGVVLETGQHLKAETVIANADMRQTVLQLTGAEHFPENFVRRIETMAPSLSVFAVYIATDLDLTALKLGHESFCYGDFDHECNFARTLSGEIAWLTITIPTLADAQLAPEGRHIVMLTTLLPYNAAHSWAQAKPFYQARMLEMAERYMPGLAKHSLYIEAGSPHTMQRYTLNYQGAAYGWAATPEQTGANRIANRSPVPGLYFSGHWCSPGGGVYGASVSGVQAAQQVLGIRSSTEFWASLQPLNCVM
ncbi:MAG: phytoene desaturase family protein [Gammaproteobacteria bacterium]